MMMREDDFLFSGKKRPRGHRKRQETRFSPLKNTVVVNTNDVNDNKAPIATKERTWVTIGMNETWTNEA